MQRISRVYLSLASRSSGLVDMPDARGAPFLGAISSIIDSDGGRRLHEYIDSLHKRHGPIFRGRMGPTQAVFISSSNIVREVFRLEGPMPKHFLPEAWLQYNRIRNRKRGLLFMDDDEWLKHRRIMNKAMLSAQSLDLMMKPCYQAAKDLAKMWKVLTNNDRIVPDLELLLYQWSLEVVLATMAGPIWPTYREQIATELGALTGSLRRIFEHSVDLSRVPARLALLLRLPSWTGFVASADHALSTVERYIGELARMPGYEAGLMGQMADLGMSVETLRRVVGDLVVSAGDTTSYSMQWLLYLIASHYPVQERICEELRSAEDDPEQIFRNPLLRGAIKESMRLYPIAPFVTRFLPQDSLLGGYPVFKGELLVISMYTSGRDEVSFPRAADFLPERWLRDEGGEFRGVNNPSATLPFAMGARSCVGRKLAECQMSLAIAELLKHFEIDCLNKHEIEMKLRMISAPSKPLILKLTPRR